ncbi:TetR family transcriptional regulator [Catellatospora sp. TT07R-123]|uniref:TetR/AcrR family transcriptional regulator n=1 Tax=Catellatospora sp. TT07R-123 TaxID=2733863 RepID=UPI001B2D1CA6|nr:TetR/AcrR family transcriptional regulator [Catellatospora sp. TT07R-123]GHJ43813.1 TetR family transcriptional regulator [Catellatospora sp. TT07R-123]
MDDARSRLVAAAIGVFAEAGYDGASVQQVVTRAGLTKGSFYYYFPSKEELLFEIYGSVLAAQLSALEAILARGLAPEATLRAVVADVVASTADNITAAAVFSRESNRLDQAHWQTLREHWRRYLDLVRGVIRAGQASGDFSAAASPETVSWMIFGVTTSMPTWYRADGPKTPAEIADEMCAVVFTGLTRGSAAPG